jgi:hypothetical protein
MERYRKLIAAVAGAAVQVISVWAGAPAWVLALVPLLTAVAVWGVRNEQEV